MLLIKLISLRNKSDSYVEHIYGNFVVLMISKTNLENSFHEDQSLIRGYIAFNVVDRNSNAI